MGLKTKAAVFGMSAAFAGASWGFGLPAIGRAMHDMDTARDAYNTASAPAADVKRKLAGMEFHQAREAYDRSVFLSGIAGATGLLGMSVVLVDAVVAAAVARRRKRPGF